MVVERCIRFGFQRTVVHLRRSVEDNSVCTPRSVIEVSAHFKRAFTYLIRRHSIDMLDQKVKASGRIGHQTNCTAGRSQAMRICLIHKKLPSCFLESTLRQDGKVELTWRDVVATWILDGDVVAVRIHASQHEHGLPVGVHASHTFESYLALRYTQFMLDTWR